MNVESKLLLLVADTLCLMLKPLKWQFLAVTISGWRYASWPHFIRNERYNVLLKNLIVAQLVCIMDPEGLLPSPEEPEIGPCPEPDAF